MTAAANAEKMLLAAKAARIRATRARQRAAQALERNRQRATESREIIDRLKTRDID